jgi:hypothetical protein
MPKVPCDAAALTMWYSRKFAPLFPISIFIGGAVSLWKKPAIEAYTVSIAMRSMLYIAPALLTFVAILFANVLMICLFGRRELKERLKAQWRERFLAVVDNRSVDNRFEDMLDYVALCIIWYSKLTYVVHIWDWHQDER